MLIKANLRKSSQTFYNTFKQAHHALSRNLRTHRTIQKAARNKNNPFHIDEFLNGIPVDTWRNQFNHNAYDTRVRNLLNRQKKMGSYGIYQV